MLFADWLGQVVVFPAQLAAGTLVSLLVAVISFSCYWKSRTT
ncbi:hypothetical protein OH492_29330 [Vibrio chagasii]|nr:hypothetical protein [Vibrio chagasii]